VLAAAPVTVVVPDDAEVDAAPDVAAVAAAVAVVDGEVLVPDEPLVPAELVADELAAVVAGCVLKLSRATRPVIVAAAEKMTRFIVAFPDQNSKDSWWMWRRETPAARRAFVAAAVIPSGPHR